MISANPYGAERKNKLKILSIVVSFIAWVSFQVTARREVWLLYVSVEGLTQPDTWDDPDPCDPYRRVQLSPSSREYEEVHKNVRQTAGSSLKQVIKV